MIMNDFAGTQVPYIHFQSMALTERPVHVSPDGCVLVGYDSLLVCWLSSTSKSGTFYLLAPLPSTHCHTIMRQCLPCCSPHSQSIWVQSWRVCCWACARTWQPGGLTCSQCWKPVSSITEHPCYFLLSGSSDSWWRRSTETQWALVDFQCGL